MVRFFAIAIGSIALAGVAGASAFGGWASRFMPQAALAIDNSSPNALTAINDGAWKAKDKSQFQKVAKTNAIRVLEREPLSYRALRQLGIYYVMAGEQSRGRELVAMSTKLTRRDALGQMWLADSSARLGDLDGALRAFDIVIRTQPEAREVAFGAMSGALADPRFRASFVKLAATNPPWLSPFVAFAIGTSKRPADLADVLSQLQPLSKSILPEKEAGTLLSRLTSEAPIENARDLYLLLPGARRATLTSISFPNAEEAFRYSPFGWEVFDNAGVQAFGSGKNADVVIEALVLPGYRGTAARKLLFLPKGTHRWKGTASLTDMSQGASAAMGLYCYVAPGQWSRTADFRLREGTNQFDFQVPGDCRAQLLSLDLAGSENQNDSAMTLRSMQLQMVPAA